MPVYTHDRYIDPNRFEVTTEDGEVLLAEIHVTEATHYETNVHTLHSLVHLYHQGQDSLQHAAGIDTNMPLRKDKPRWVQSDATRTAFYLGYGARMEIMNRRIHFVDTLKINSVVHHDVPSI